MRSWRHPGTPQDLSSPAAPNRFRSTDHRYGGRPSPPYSPSPTRLIYLLPLIRFSDPVFLNVNHQCLPGPAVVNLIHETHQCRPPPNPPSPAAAVRRDTPHYTARPDAEGMRRTKENREGGLPRVRRKGTQRRQPFVASPGSRFPRRTRCRPRYPRASRDPAAGSGSRVGRPVAGGRLISPVDPRAEGAPAGDGGQNKEVDGQEDGAHPPVPPPAAKRGCALVPVGRAARGWLSRQRDPPAHRYPQIHAGDGH